MRTKREFSGRVFVWVLGGLTTLAVWPAANAHAQLTLPFSTTYNCAEQDQRTAGWVTCDGIKKHGDWTTSSGSREQITSAANYPGGGGGRGQRHWIGPSYGNTDGSGSVFFPFAAMQQEVYIRWHTRWQAGLKLGGITAPILRAQKLVYFTGTNCGQSGGCVFDIEGSGYSFTVNGTSVRCGGGWDALFGGVNAASNGQWISFVLRVKNETNNANNGIVQAWANGQLVCDLQSVDFKGSTGFGGFAFPENHQFTTVNGADMYQDLDDVTISTTLAMTPQAPTNVRIVR